MGRGSPLESSKSRSTVALGIWCRRQTAPAPGFPTEDSRCGALPAANSCPTTIAARSSTALSAASISRICWIKDPTDALMIQIQGSARVRLDDGTMLRITDDPHNGYAYVPVGRILIERNIIPREEMSLERIGEWMRANPQSAEEVRRQSRSFVFFRIAGLSDDREAVGAQGVPLTPGRSAAVDNSLHVYGPPSFIHAGLPLANYGRTVSLDPLVIAQDPGWGIVGPAAADIYWGAGDRAGPLAGGILIPAGSRCWCPANSTPSQRGSECHFRR